MLLTAQVVEQHLGRFDAYDLLFGGLAVAGCLGRLTRAVCRPAGLRGLRGARSSPLDELLILFFIAGLSVFVLHQLVTDTVCHGRCALP